MSGYNPPLDDINFCIRHLTDIDNILSLDPFEGMDVADLEQVLEEAGKFARDVIAPVAAGEGELAAAARECMGTLDRIDADEAQG